MASVPYALPRGPLSIERAFILVHAIERGRNEESAVDGTLYKKASRLSMIDSIVSSILTIYPDYLMQPPTRPERLPVYYEPERLNVICDALGISYDGYAALISYNYNTELFTDTDLMFLSLKLVELFSKNNPAGNRPN